MKKSVKLLLALVVLAVAVGAFWLVQKKGPKDEETQTEYITTADSDDLYRYAYSLDGTMYEFTCDSEDGWKYDGDEEFNLDDSKLSVVIQYLWSTSVLRTLTDVSDESFAEFGLDEPVGQIAITLNDGTEETFYVGASNATVGGYYLYKNDDTSTVYIVSTDITSAYGKELEDLEGSESITTETDDSESGDTTETDSQDSGDTTE